MINAFAVIVPLVLAKSSNSCSRQPTEHFRGDGAPFVRQDDCGLYPVSSFESDQSKPGRAAVDLIDPRARMRPARAGW
jgi:hypothetical protein